MKSGLDSSEGARDARRSPLNLARVVVVGTSCSGKTTLAHRLASTLGTRFEHDPEEPMSSAQVASSGGSLVDLKLRAQGQVLEGEVAVAANREREEPEQAEHDPDHRVEEGREVTYVILTNGNKGSGDRSVTSEQLAPIREDEQRRAAHVLGVEHVEFLGYEDGELEDTRELRRDVTREIRRWRPHLVIPLNPHRTYNNFPGWHRDHRVTGRMVLDCVYPLARDHLAFPELSREDEPHSVREVYFIQWAQPRLVIDISETMELKLEAIRCHASQIGDFKDFEARMRNGAAILGQEKGYSYAEGFDQIVVPG